MRAIDQINKHDGDGADQTGGFGLDDPHGIRRRREALGWNERELARRAGVPYQRVQALERVSPAGKQPYSRYLADVMRALDEGEGNPAGPLPSNPRFAPLPGRSEVPVYAMRPNESGGMELTGILIGIARTTTMAHIQGAYAVQVWGSGMAPKYHPRDIVFINPLLSPRPFGGVLVMSEDRADVHIGEFVSETPDEWIIKQFGDAPAEKRLSRASYPDIHAIVSVSTDLISI